MINLKKNGTSRSNIQENHFVFIYQNITLFTRVVNFPANRASLGRQGAESLKKRVLLPHPPPPFKSAPAFC